MNGFSPKNQQRKVVKNERDSDKIDKKNYLCSHQQALYILSLPTGKVLLHRRLKGNCVQITNCPATVSNEKGFTNVVHCLHNHEMGRNVKLLQVRRPACSELTMLSWIGATVGLLQVYLRYLVFFCRTNSKA